jgi:hypothetical protein
LSGIFGISPAGEADDQVAALPGDRAQGGLGVRAADGVVDDVGSVAAGQLLDPLLEVLGGVVDASSAPWARQNASLSAPRAAAITRAPSSLPSSTAARPTPPAAPRTSRVSPGFYGGAVGEGVHGCAVGDHARGGDVERDGVREQVTRRGDDEALGEGAVDHGDATRSPGATVGDAGADGGDEAGRLAAGA